MYFTLYCDYFEQTRRDFYNLELFVRLKLAVFNLYRSIAMLFMSLCDTI